MDNNKANTQDQHINPNSFGAKSTNENIVQKVTKSGGKSSDTEFYCLVLNREKTLFEGKVLSVSSNNAEGPFDVLASHSNFITIIKDYVTVITPDEKKISFKLQSSGVLRVYNNTVKVFIGLLTHQKLQEKHQNPE